MTRFTQLRLACAVVGILVWAYGYRVDDPTLRLIGIVGLAVALGLRFVPKRFRGEDDRAA